MEESAKRSHGRLAFGILRALVLGYQVWGRRSGWCVDELASFLHTDEAHCSAILDYLHSYGWVQMDHTAGTARLTPAGVRRFATTSRIGVLSGTSPTVGSVC